jgi:DNA-binding transcriptional ArsR family regulator
MQMRDFKGIWIPREVWEHPGLAWYDKIVLMEVDSLTKRDMDCFFSDEHLAEFVGVSQRTIRNSLLRLEQAGLLERTGFDGRKRYMRSLLPGNTAPDAGQPGKACRADRQPLPKKKTNEKTNEKTVVIPWESPEFLGMWDTWKEDRRGRRIKPYTATGEQAALHKLFNECHGDVSVAVATIQNSIANGYQGLFPPKQKPVQQGIDLDRLARWTAG